MEEIFIQFGICGIHVEINVALYGCVFDFPLELFKVCDVNVKIIAIF